MPKVPRLTAAETEAMLLKAASGGCAQGAVIESMERADEESLCRFTVAPYCIQENRQAGDRGNR